MSDKKKHQLGMNPSTASHRLKTDILWALIVETNQDICHRCGKKMTRDTFSIEHKEAWMDTEDPVGNFFDLDNIAFSHRSCNYAAARRTLAECGTHTAYCRGCRCDACTKASTATKREYYSKESRHERYKRTGN